MAFKRSKLIGVVVGVPWAAQEKIDDRGKGPITQKLAGKHGGKAITTSGGYAFTFVFKTLDKAQAFQKDLDNLK